MSMIYDDMKSISVVERLETIANSLASVIVLANVLVFGIVGSAISYSLSSQHWLIGAVIAVVLGALWGKWVAALATVWIDWAAQLLLVHDELLMRFEETTEPEQFEAGPYASKRGRRTRDATRRVRASRPVQPVPERRWLLRHGRARIFRHPDENAAIVTEISDPDDLQVVGTVDGPGGMRFYKIHTVGGVDGYIAEHELS